MSKRETPEHQGKLSRKEAKVRRECILGLDTEDHKGKTVAYGFWDNITPSFYTRSNLEALQYILDYRNPLDEGTEKSLVIVVCHNLEYDLVNLFKETNYSGIDTLTYASRLIKATLKDRTKHEIYFMDSCAFFPGSLKAMGDIIGIPKMEGSPFDPKYVVNDARIAWQFTDNMRQTLNRDGLSMTLTLGSMAMSDFRTNYVPENGYITHNTPLCLEAYYGGRVEVFYKGEIIDEIFDADINSCYPDVMQAKEYPNTAFIEESTLATHRFGVGYFRVLVPEDIFVPPLPYHSPEGRLFFPVGEVEGAWTYEEVRYAVSRGCTVLKEFPGGEGTNAALRPFKEFVDVNYEARIDAENKIKKCIDAGIPAHAYEFLKLYLKGKMNNLYGKFSQNRDQTQMTRDKLTPKQCEKLGMFVENTLGPFYSYKVKRKKAPPTANYMWGTYITSYARLSLLQKMNAVHDAGGQLLYCDTDSILFTGVKAKDALSYSDTRLGAMKVKTYEAANFVMAKGYYLCKDDGNGAFVPVKLACKGVNQIHGMEYLHGHPVKYEKPVRLKEGLRAVYAKTNIDKGDAFMREHSENSWHEITKAQKSVYFKRTGDKGVTRPINSKDIPALESKNYSVEAQKTNDPIQLIITPKKFTKALFTKAVTEEGWEKEWFKGTEAKVAQEYSKRGIEFLSPQRCLDMNVGDSWFSGKVFALERNRHGKQCFLVGLSTYDGKPAYSLGIMVSVPTYIFNHNNFIGIKKDESFIGKYVEFILIENYLTKYSNGKYIGNTPLILRGKVMESEPNEATLQKTTHSA